MTDLKKLIREIPDWPKPGILFYDITPLLKDPAGWKTVIDRMRDHFANWRVDGIIGIEARGFFFAPTLAYALGTGFIPVRKPKKLPAAVERIEYELEYGVDSLEIHRDAILPGGRYLVVDDVLATGGTASAVAKLVERCGGKLAGLGFVIELSFLKGRERLKNYELYSMIQY